MIEYPLIIVKEDFKGKKKEIKAFVVFLFVLFYTS